MCVCVCVCVCKMNENNYFRLEISGGQKVCFCLPHLFGTMLNIHGWSTGILYSRQRVENM